jgi:NAD(P)H-hydrate epimerase
MTETVPTYTAAQVRGAEKPLLEAGEPLMLRAAASLARVAAGELGRDFGRVLVLVGSGDNGGDALFAGAQLAEIEDVTVDVFLTSDRVHEAGLGAAIAAGARKIDLPEVVAAASDYDLVLDGILGIGASGSSGGDPSTSSGTGGGGSGGDPSTSSGTGGAALRGTARTVVEALLPAVRAGKPRVIAVDLPSGLQPDDGSSDGTVLPASVTVTFGAVKAGLVIGSGPERAGSIVLVDIGLGPGLADVEPVGEADIAAVMDAERP